MSGVTTAVGGLLVPTTMSPLSPLKAESVRHCSPPESWGSTSGRKRTGPATRRAPDHIPVLAPWMLTRLISATSAESLRRPLAGPMKGL